MSFNKKMIIMCDSCKELLDTGEKDTNSCNLLASWDGWLIYKINRKTKHKCPKCKNR